MLLDRWESVQAPVAPMTRDSRCQFWCQFGSERRPPAPAAPACRRLLEGSPATEATIARSSRGSCGQAIAESRGCRLPPSLAWMRTCAVDRASESLRCQIDSRRRRTNAAGSEQRTSSGRGRRGGLACARRAAL